MSRRGRGYPWNGKVDIDFTLDSKATEPYQMQVEVYDNVGKTNLPVKSVCTENVSVEANPCMVRTDTTRIVWDAAKDLPNGFKCTNVLVTCRDARLSVSNFCVISLVDGSKEWLNAIPQGGWTDEHRTNKIVFARVNPGAFYMGSVSDDLNRPDNEDYHQVTLTNSYYGSIYELTEAQVAALDGNAGTMMPALRSYASIRGFEYQYKNGWKTTGYYWPQTYNVDSTSIIGKLRTLVGNDSLDLLTEAEWEMAAKGGVGDKLPYTGEPVSDAVMVQIGRYSGNVNDKRGDVWSTTYTWVGYYVPYAKSLHDMLGNAEEWCLDNWVERLGTDAVVCLKGKEGSNMFEMGIAGNYRGQRVLKGGGYYYQFYCGGGTVNLVSEDCVLNHCRVPYRRRGVTSVGDHDGQVDKAAIRLKFYVSGF